MKRNLNWNKLLLELLVVFLGVTAGFVLNNSRANKDNKEIEEKYIQSFIQNIDSNNVRLSETIAEDTIWLDLVGETLSEYEDGEAPIDSIPMLMREVLSTSVISLNYNTYEDIKNSGHLHLIRNFEVKEKIVRYHKSIDNMEYVDGYYNTFFTDFILPFAMKNMDIFHAKLLTQDRKTYSSFFNHVGGYYTMRQQRTAVLEELFLEGKGLKKELVSYLESEF